ncbi:MAG: hypothetical protein AAB932_01965 [Patescibacteria group bacterium]
MKHIFAQKRGKAAVFFMMVAAMLLPLFANAALPKTPPPVSKNLIVTAGEMTQNLAPEYIFSHDGHQSSLQTVDVSIAPGGSLKFFVKGSRDGASDSRYAMRVKPYYQQNPEAPTEASIVDFSRDAAWTRENTFVFPISSNITSPNSVRLFDVVLFSGRATTRGIVSDDYAVFRIRVSAPLPVIIVETSTLDITKDSALGNKTLARGSTHILAQFVLHAGAIEDVCLVGMSLSFQAPSGAFNAPTDVQNLELWIDGAQVGLTFGFVGTSTNQFFFTSNVNVCLEKNERKVLMVKGYVPLSAGSGPVSAVIDPYIYYGRSSLVEKTAIIPVIGQEMRFASANVIITPVDDETTVSGIRLPSQTPVQLGKWAVTAQNDAVTVRRITFQVKDDSGADDTSSGNFGELFLYDENNMAVPLGRIMYVPGTGNGYVRFEGLNWQIPADTVKRLVLKGVINGSGNMEPGSINAFLIRSDSSLDMDITSGSGERLSANQIDAVFGDNTANSRFATSTYYLFHNAAPTIVNRPLGTNLPISSQAPLFAYTISNGGDRTMRVESAVITVTASGLASNASTTGAIRSWQLWEANANGGLGFMIASSTQCALVGSENPVGCDVSGVAGGTLTVVFDPSNDVDNFLDNCTVSAGGSRTFYLVADTTHVFDGKTFGTVSVSARLDGATGFLPGANVHEDNWADGAIDYYYTPIGGSENIEAYSASDSYDVVGGVLSRTL